MTATAPIDTPEAALDAFARTGALRPVESGLVNRTWAVGTPPQFALQLVHARFGDADNARIEAVTRRLRADGLATPELVRTPGGALSRAGPDGCRWRLLTWLDGEVHARPPSAAHVQSAAALLARFHDILAGSPEGAALPPTDFHDTDAYMQRLATLIDAQADDEIGPVADAILSAWQTWRDTTTLPPRPGHGDPKLPNVIFRSGSAEALALIDLDTLAQYGLDDELGDAIRSCCNPGGENAVDGDIDTALFTAFMQGYARQSATMTADERGHIVHGVGRIALELASRFCADAIECRYFAWDPAAAPTARDHNLRRARGQLHLSPRVATRRGERERIVAAA